MENQQKPSDPYYKDDVKLAIDNIHVGKRWIIATIFDDGRMPS